VYFDDAQRELFRDDEVGQTESLEDYPATARVLETMQPLVVHVSDPDSDPSELAYMCSASGENGKMDIKNKTLS